MTILKPVLLPQLFPPVCIDHPAVPGLAAQPWARGKKKSRFEVTEEQRQEIREAFELFDQSYHFRKYSALHPHVCHLPAWEVRCIWPHDRWPVTP